MLTDEISIVNLLTDLRSSGLQANYGVLADNGVAVAGAGRWITAQF